MTFLQRLLGVSNSLSPNEERFWRDAYSLTTASGIRVSADGALKISTAWACGRLISESVAMLPKIVYERQVDGGKQRATGHPLYNLLHDQPNRRQTSFEFFDMLQMHALFHGNGYAKIIPGPRGPVDKLIPILPNRVKVEEVDEDTLRYRVTERDGSEKIYNDDEIFHLRGLSLNGVDGVSVVDYARESFGLTLATEHSGAKFFANNSSPSGVLEHAGQLSEEAQTRLRNQVEEMISGENMHRLLVLEEGLKWQPVGISPEQAQFLQTREFQAEDVCRWFRVPPHMVGLTSKSTSWGSGIEEMSRGFVTYVLLPWLTRWEQLIGKDLIIASQKYFVEILTEALLRGDIQKRYNAYAIGRQWGWLATNEIRKAENLNPTDFGDDDYLTPLNMQKTTTIEPVPAGGATREQLTIEYAKNYQHKSMAMGGVHYEKLLLESAGRVARKELAAMSRSAQRLGGTGDWARAVEEFFSTHAEFVAQTMCIPIERVAPFVEWGKRTLEEHGPVVLDGWEEKRTQQLAKLTMEDNRLITTLFLEDAYREEEYGSY